MQRDWNRFVAVCFMAMSLALLAAVIAKPTGRFVIVVARPFSPPTRVIDIIGDAGGTFVSGGRFSWIVVAYSDSTDFPTRLLRSGAILVLNNWAAVGCMERVEP